MKKFILFLFVFFNFMLYSEAKDLKTIQYKNIEDGAKIKLENYAWKDKVNKKDSDYFVKILSSEDLSFDYFNSNGMYAFSTDCDYEFIYKGNLIGYSNSDLKFYDITLIDGKLIKRTLSNDDVQKMFPNYKIISISEFSENTNSLKIKKDSTTLKLILLNDTDLKFDGYSFSTGNSKIEKYKLLGFLDLKRKGMIHFSKNKIGEEKNPWYILLVR